MTEADNQFSSQYVLMSMGGDSAQIERQDAGRCGGWFVITLAFMATQSDL